MRQEGDKRYALGVDLGGTKIEIACVDALGVIQEKIRFPTKATRSPQEIIAEIAAKSKELVEGDFHHILGIGIGVAGQIDPSDGKVFFAPNLKWHDVPLEEELGALVGLPVIVTNDVRAATWGEWLYGAGMHCDDLVCLFVGTGIGGGIISGGHLLEGVSNTAGELGHIVIDSEGPLCGCGNRGCFEAFAGGRFIAKKAQEEIEKAPEAGERMRKLAEEKSSDITAQIVTEAYRQEDPLAVELMEGVKKALAAGVTSIVNALNPGIVIMGGGVVEGLPELVEETEREVRYRALKAATRSLKIVKAKLGGEAGVIGAAALVMKHYLLEESDA